MARLKLQKFLGKAPKVSPELLPAVAAQEATNCKLYSGDLIPYPFPVIVGDTSLSGITRTLYGLRDPDDNSLVFLAWDTDVDVAIASITDTNEQRFYYTGDGLPKVSTYELATSGSPPYPTSFYELGFEVPDVSQIPTATAVTPATAETTSYARDNSGVTTLVTSAAHGFRSGNSLSIQGFTVRTGTYTNANPTTITITDHGLETGATITLDFTSGGAASGVYDITKVTDDTFTVTLPSAPGSGGNVDWDISGFNLSNTVCTVIDDTTLTYFNPGFEVTATTTNPPAQDGRVDLAGETEARTYVFTWFTPWDEESGPSKSSDIIYIKTGTQVDVTNLPTTPPAGDNYIRGIRLYRTIGGSGGSDFIRLNTLWYPTGITTVQRDTNIAKITTEFPHNLAVNDIVKISGCTDATFDDTDVLVTDIIDDFSFLFDQTGTDTPATADATGTLFHDVSENPGTTTARYWGDAGDYTFVDDFDSLTLFGILDSEDNFPPPVGLTGLTLIQNNILAGFVDNELYLSKIGKPYAWPESSTYALEYNVVGVAAIAGSALILTEGYPYILAGSNPSQMSLARVDAFYPCLSAQSIVAMDYGIVYSTHDGLAVYSPASGARIVTGPLHSNDTWQTEIDPTSVVAAYYGANYFASHSAGAFVFEQDAQAGGFFVDCTYTFDASWYDPISGNLFYAAGTAGDVSQWDDLTQPLSTQSWKSKVLVTQDMVNFGAARVIADYEETETQQWDTFAETWDATTFKWTGATDVIFRMYADRALVYENTISSGSMFRLPTGYRTDTYEVEVEGNIRIRAVHLAETPLELKQV
jgi:hypothetical protein